MTHSLPSPETITRTELPNGVVVLIRENHDSPSVVVAGYLWAGSLGEGAAQAGLSNLTSGMLMRGTEAKSFGQINEVLESVGAQFGFHSGVHTTGFGGKALAEDLGLLLDILGDCLQHPTFPADEMERLRGQILTGIQRRAYDTRRMAELTFDELLFPDHPYGRSVLGYENTVSRLGREDLRSFYQGHYSPQGLVLAIVGAVPASAALEKVQTSLGGWQAAKVTPDRSKPQTVQLQEQRRASFVVPGKTQSDLVIGWPGLARTDPDYMKAHLTNIVLGVFGMMGRLGDVIREQQGLAYYCYSELDAGYGAGAWTASAGVQPANVERTVASIRSEVRRLRDEAVQGEELADSQSFLTGSMPLRLETNEGVAGSLLDMERHQLGFDYLQRYASLVNAVSVEHLREMANKYLDPDVYALAVAGPEG